jgi:hypothetical protein
MDGECCPSSDRWRRFPFLPATTVQAFSAAGGLLGTSVVVTSMSLLVAVVSLSVAWFAEAF